jgi:hypothetical protein
MLRSEVRELVLEPIPYQRFLAMSADDLRDILAELPSGREKRKSPLDEVAIGSLIRVMDRGGHSRVSDLGPSAARAWSARIGVSSSPPD